MVFNCWASIIFEADKHSGRAGLSADCGLRKRSIQEYSDVKSSKMYYHIYQYST